MITIWNFKNLRAGFVAAYCIYSFCCDLSKTLACHIKKNKLIWSCQSLSKNTHTHIYIYTYTHTYIYIPLQQETTNSSTSYLQCHNKVQLHTIIPILKKTNPCCLSNLRLHHLKICPSPHTLNVDVLCSLKIYTPLLDPPLRWHIIPYDPPFGILRGFYLLHGV